jgi:hypothetical protein
LGWALAATIILIPEFTFFAYLGMALAAAIDFVPVSVVSFNFYIVAIFRRAHAFTSLIIESFFFTAFDWEAHTGACFFVEVFVGLTDLAVTYASTQF